MRATLNNTKGRDEKGLSAEAQAMREKAAADSAAAKAAKAQAIKDENAAAAMIQAQYRGNKDRERVAAMGLSDEQLAARKALAEKKAQDKAAKDAQLAKQNLQMRANLNNTTGRDEKGLSAETLAMRGRPQPTAPRPRLRRIQSLLNR